MVCPTALQQLWRGGLIANKQQQHRKVYMALAAGLVATQSDQMNLGRGLGTKVRQPKNTHAHKKNTHIYTITVTSNTLKHTDERAHELTWRQLKVSAVSQVETTHYLQSKTSMVQCMQQAQLISGFVA